MDAALAELTDTNAESSIRRAAALKVGSLRAEATAADVAKVVQELANDHNCDVGGGAISVRRAALLAFTELARSDDGSLPDCVASCVPAVTKLMTHPDEDAREMAVRACSALGPSANTVGLIAALEDSAENVRAAAADALVGLRALLDANDVEMLVHRLTRVDAADDDDDLIRAEILQVIARIGGAAAASQINVITGCLEDEAATMRAAAAKAIGTIGKNAAASHIAAIAALLEDTEACVRAEAIEALGLIGDAETHAESVSELLADSDRGVRSAASATLKRWEQ